MTGVSFVYAFRSRGRAGNTEIESATTSSGQKSLPSPFFAVELDLSIHSAILSNNSIDKVRRSMRWTIARLLSLMTAVALVLAVATNGPVVLRPNSHAIVFLWLYLVLLVPASLLAANPHQRWRRFWLAFSLFGWSFIACMSFAGQVLDYNMSRGYTPLIGVAGGCSSAFLFIALSSSQPGKALDNETQNSAR
jgi:hypothetical protein